MFPWKYKGHCFIFFSLHKHHNSMINTSFLSSTYSSRARERLSFSSFLHITNIFLTILSKIKTQKTRVIYTRACVHMHKLLFDHQHSKCIRSFSFLFLFFKDLSAYTPSLKIDERRSTNTIRLTKSYIDWSRLRSRRREREREKETSPCSSKTLIESIFFFFPHLRRQIANDQKQHSLLRILRLTQKRKNHFLSLSLRSYPIIRKKIN